MAVGEVATVPQQPEGARPAFRRDLQGVRGLGIIFIVVGHLWRWPPGVYAMLDMFFVLSGFLITGILIAALPRYGGRFLAVFYLGRIRRLMPAAITVLVLSTLLFYVVASPARGNQVASEAALAAVWVVNWHFALSGSDYFAPSTASSPIVHYWSLSVEEQFYLVWPVLLLGILFLARRRRTAEAHLLVGLGAVTAVAFGYSMWHSVHAPIEAYYSTLDRTWEFGIGGLTAVLAARLARLPLWAGFVLGWGGVIGLMISLFTLPFGVPFPAPWGLVPVLLTVAILAGGIDRDTRYLPVLDNRPMIYLGDISYSVYLWHLPINLLILPLFPAKGVEYYASAIALTAAVSVATYHLLERPMRRATWLMTPPERERARARTPSRSRRRPGWVALGLTPIIALAVVALAPVELAASPRVPALPEATTSATAVDGLLAAQQDRVIAALEQKHFPELDPPLGELDADRWGREISANGCFQVAETDLDRCRFGPPSARHTAVVIGDSEAVAWMPGIRAALVPMGWDVQQITWVQCPAWTFTSYVDAERVPYPECERQHRLFTQYVLDRHPDLVILASSSHNVANAGRAGFPDDEQKVAARGAAATLEALAPSGARLVILGDPPDHGNLVTCVTRIGTPESCVVSPDRSWEDARSGEEQAASEAGVQYISTLDWFCYQSRCPAFVGTTPVTVDGLHLTIEYSQSLGPLLREALLREPD